MSRYKVEKPSGRLIALDSPMIGATSSTAGISGLAPPPAAGDNNKVLQGDATWIEINKNFVGSLFLWNSLSVQEKKQYKTADIIPIIITYDSNGGSGSMPFGTTMDGNYIIKDSIFIAPAGKEFVSWNTEADGSGISYNVNDECIFNTDVTLYAQWLVALKFSSNSAFRLLAYHSWNGTIEYTLDNGNTWTEWDGSELFGDENQSIYLRGINNTVITGSGGNSWTFTGKYCTGNIETLLDYQTVASGQHPTMGDYCYAYMFYGCTSLITAPQLPATTLANSCYADMFDECISLITVPELPATTLADSCYMSMFMGCRALTTAPELPATILANSCYYTMFSYCTSLVTAPELPAITLANKCYCGMFTDCTSLTTTPELPVTTLADRCYQSMFKGCTSLTTLPELPATTLAERCYNGMFSKCTSLTIAPELPAITLVEGCYREMFRECTSLTTAPKLPATTLIEDCYYEMFGGCTSLKLSTTQTGNYQYAYRIPTSGTGTTASNALTYMFDSTGGTFTGTPTINTTYYTDHQPV